MSNAEYRTEEIGNRHSPPAAIRKQSVPSLRRSTFGVRYSTFLPIHNVTDLLRKTRNTATLSRPHLVTLSPCHPP